VGVWGQQPPGGVVLLCPTGPSGGLGAAAPISIKIPPQLNLLILFRDLAETADLDANFNLNKIKKIKKYN